MAVTPPGAAAALPAAALFALTAQHPRTRGMAMTLPSICSRDILLLK